MELSEKVNKIFAHIKGFKSYFEKKLGNIPFGTTEVFKTTFLKQRQNGVLINYLATVPKCTGTCAWKRRRLCMQKPMSQNL
jgi:hypothetical protein